MANELFLELDTEKSGKIKKSKFVEYLNKYPSTDKAFKSFYDTINEELYSKSEKIISKLKKLKEKHYVKEDKDTLSDIDW